MSRKYNYSFIKHQFEKYNYELLSKVYINAHTKLKYRCPKGHIHSITWNHWRDGHRCPYCDGQMSLSLVEVHSVLEKEGYILLTKEYKNSKQKLDYICPVSHEGSVTLSNWMHNKTRCSKCEAINKANKRRLSMEYIINSFKKEGYILLTTEYKNVEQKLKCVCPNGHMWLTTWHCWNSGVRCPKCFDGASKWEKDIRVLIDDINIKYVPNDRIQLVNPVTGRALELDLWFPQLNKAIECNGDYWHSFEGRPECDNVKLRLCKDLGIELLVIMYSEWEKDLQKCKNRITDFLD